MPEPELTPDLTALAAALGRLSPAPPAVDRDRLFFEAGRRAARPRPWGWPLATALCASVAVALGLRLMSVSGPEVARVIPPPPPPPAEPQSPPPAAPAAFAAAPARSDDAPYLSLRDQVLRWGVDVLPQYPVAAPTTSESIEDLLGLPPGGLTDDEKARWKARYPRGDV
jgi:hypothetical protein